MSFTSRTKIWSLYNVGNGLYRVFTTGKKGTFFPAKEGVHSRNTFFGHFSPLLKSGGTHAPVAPPPGSAAPVIMSSATGIIRPVKPMYNVSNEAL
jgi:hypothetical protein